jgi:glycine/D-amino acid oxidase-like deaminating enzyme
MSSAADVVIAGAGIAGISTAYHLTSLGVERVTLCDPLPPLTLTSDKSTECYRNWWPGPDDTMVSFMNRSIDLLEEWADVSSDIFNLSRRGYLYLTADESELERMADQAAEISALGAGELRIHETDTSGYLPSAPHGWKDAPGGADLFMTGEAVRSAFPYVSGSVVGGLHARRAGWVSAQQLGMWLLETARDRGAELVQASVTGVEVTDGEVAAVTLSNGRRIATNRFVNAAGPLVEQVAGLVGIQLPVRHEVHRKISFRDRLGAVPREAPMLIWNDPQELAWTDEERELLDSDRALTALLGRLAAGAHCRPDGPPDGAVVLGLWEYRTDVRMPTFPIPEDPMYPELVMRGLATMLPAVGSYLDHLPHPYVDGGYYTKTSENRPLIGPAGPRGFFLIGALSGYGVMAAPAAGELVARHVLGLDLPVYARRLTPERYRDPDYLRLVSEMNDQGQL